jgi:hypothetical protein
MKGRDMNKIVPIEPTEEMIKELQHEWDSVGATSMYDNYTAMLSAAPESDHIIVSRAEYEQMKGDAELGKLVRSKMISGNSVPVSRCTITADEIEAIDKAMKG